MNADIARAGLLTLQPTAYPVALALPLTVGFRRHEKPFRGCFHVIAREQIRIRFWFVRLRGRKRSATRQQRDDPSDGNPSSIEHSSVP